MDPRRGMSEILLEVPTVPTGAADQTQKGNLVKHLGLLSVMITKNQEEMIEMILDLAAGLGLNSFSG